MVKDGVRVCSYHHLFGDEHTVLTQYFIKQGLKKFGDPGVNAVSSELKQVHDRNVVTPMHKCDLTQEEINKSLGYLMFLKKKRCGKIKARGCADGRKQRVYKNKIETSSPTVSTEALLMSCVIDAEEQRDVATCDVPGAFMQADIDEKIHVVMEDELAELFVKLKPKLYSQYVMRKNGKSTIFLRLNKALYGTLQAALMFWQDL